jgi:drug/metabolite transporter (DMT)-like permease
LQNRIPWRLTVGLALAIGLDTAVQTLWKRASGQLPQVDLFDVSAVGRLAEAVLGNPLFLLLAILMAAQIANWLKTLDYADLSFALPITALSYVSVAIVSAIWLAEALTIGRVCGMALILTGVLLVARTDPSTIKGETGRKK